MGCIKSKKKFSQKDLNILKTPFFAENSVQVWRNTFMLDCPYGELTQEVFLDLYGACFPSLFYAENFCEYFFETFDTDFNGYVDFEEFLLAIIRYSSKFHDWCSMNYQGIH